MNEKIPVILVKSNQEKLYFKSLSAASNYLGRNPGAVISAFRRKGRTKHRITKEYYYVMENNTNL